jgi:hypothetical protein
MILSLYLVCQGARYLRGGTVSEIWEVAQLKANLYGNWLFADFAREAK